MSTIVASTLVCRKCGLEKFCTDDESSDFYVKTRNPDGTAEKWGTSCKVCERKVLRAYWAASSPRQNALRREAYRSKKQDDEWIERKRKRERERARERRRTDPEYAERARQLNRENRAFRAEREGRTPKWRNPVSDEKAPRVRTRPFRSWLLEYACRAGYASEVAGGEVKCDAENLSRDLLLTARRVRSVLSNEQENVTLDVVSRALTEARFVVEVDGRVIVTVDDLYDEERGSLDEDEKKENRP